MHWLQAPQTCFAARLNWLLLAHLAASGFYCSNKLPELPVTPQFFFSYRLGLWLACEKCPYAAGQAGLVDGFYHAGFSQQVVQQQGAACFFTAASLC